MRAGGVPRAFDLPAVVGRARYPRLAPSSEGYSRRVPRHRKPIALLAAGLLALGVAGCNDSDVDKARSDIQDKADELKGSLDDVSTKDLRQKLDDVEEDAKNGSDETKQKARELQDKIERELNSRK